MSSTPNFPLPTAVTLTSERIAKLHAAAKAHAAGFVTTIDVDSPTSVAAFASVYHPSVVWYDHAFHIRRSGHAAVVGLQKSFTHCNQPFNVEVKSFMPTEKGCVVEQVWIGTCKNDIVRPDGVVAVKGTGKKFRCHVCFVLEVDEEGKIVRLDEYYNKRWDEGKEEEEYLVVKGENMAKV